MLFYLIFLINDIKEEEKISTGVILLDKIYIVHSSSAFGLALISSTNHDLKT